MKLCWKYIIVMHKRKCKAYIDPTGVLFFKSNIVSEAIHLKIINTFAQAFSIRNGNHLYPGFCDDEKPKK